MNDRGRRFLDPLDFLILVPVALLLTIQLPHLSLPYFWDEAWSYMIAVNKMADTGPSLLPGVVPLEYCKGHPQLLYFLSAHWLNLFPNGISYMRIFPLITSVGLLIAFHFGLKKTTNPQIAGMGVVFLGVQSMFLAQSILVLPEMMLSVWLVLAFFAFIRSNYKMYAFYASLMVLTKETALVFCAVFVLSFFILTSEENKGEKIRLKDLFWIVVPLITYFIFLVLHKFAFGVFFYQDHLGYIKHQWHEVWKTAGSAFVTVFVHYGRLLVLFLTIGATVFLIWKKTKITNRRALLCLAMLIPAYLFFLGINFYSPRYTLSLLVLMILAFFLLFESVPVPIRIKWMISVVISGVCLFYSFESKREIDIDLGYVEVIEVNKDIVEYCEMNSFYDQPIAASFNMNFSLKNKELGYLSGNRRFTKVEGLDHYKQAKYVIFETTTGSNPDTDWVKDNFVLKKAFENKHAYGFIYENPSFSSQQHATQ